MSTPPSPDALDLCDFFDQYGPFTHELPTVETIMAKAWLFHREGDDFEDAADPCLTSDPLPPSDWWSMDDGERERATKRQQTGMAGS